jgi:hypothetical protein
MCDNEYVAHVMVRERIREAEARAAFDAMLQRASTSPEPSGRDARGGLRRPTRLELWRHAAAAWVAHLTLPKTWNRL